VSPAKTAEPIEMSFGIWARMYSWNCVRRGSRSALVKAPSWDITGGQYSESDSAGGAPVRCGRRLAVLDGMHIHATWRIRLNRPCAAAMRPYVNYFQNLLQGVYKSSQTNFQAISGRFSGEILTNFWGHIDAVYRMDFTWF